MLLSPCSALIPALWLFPIYCLSGPWSSIVGKKHSWVVMWAELGVGRKRTRTILTNARVVMARARAGMIRARVVPTRSICSAHRTPGTGLCIKNRNYFPIIPKSERSKIRTSLGSDVWSLLPTWQLECYILWRGVMLYLTEQKVTKGMNSRHQALLTPCIHEGQSPPRSPTSQHCQTGD